MGVSTCACERARAYVQCVHLCGCANVCVYLWLQISMGMENRGRQLLANAIPLAIAGNLSPPTRAPVGSSGRVLEKAFMPPARGGCVWHPKHIKSSSGTVRLKFQTSGAHFVCQEPETLGSSPVILRCTKTGVGNLQNIHFRFPAWHSKTGVGNCWQLPKRFPLQTYVYLLD